EPTPAAHVNVVEFSPDGKRIYTTNDSGHGVVVWDIPARRPIERLSYGATVRSLSLTGDGQWLVSLTGQPAIWVWNTDTLTRGDFQPRAGFRSVVNGQVECSPQKDGHQMAHTTSTIGRTDLWDLDARHRIDSYPAGQVSITQCLAFRPDGRRL